MAEHKADDTGPAPGVPFPACLRYDVVSGFLVFMIALPLCLAIAKASGFPPIGGVLTAIVGGIVASLISNSELTIKGPAAGLIPIVALCVADMQKIDGSGAFPGYRLALAVGAVAAVLQIMLGLFKAGKLGDFFPTAAVHGLLASIGVAIMIKQFLLILGVSAKQPREMTELILEYPHFLMNFYNIPIAIIGLTSLAIMIFYPMIKMKLLKAIPVQLVVLVVAIPLGMALNLKPYTPEEADAVKAAEAEKKKADAEKTAAESKAPAEHDSKAKSASTIAHAGDAKPPAKPLDPKHSLTLAGHTWDMSPAKYLINVPLKFSDAIVTPDFTALKHMSAWKWVVFFAIIASLESLLSAKAVDILDPQKRKTDLNRDLVACGVGNLISSSIGGLPMISEIVRSRANVDNGAKTRFSNAFHGIFLLLFAALLPFVLNMIPIAALAAMLTFTGFRLAHPREFLNMYKIGLEQLIVFVTTIVAIICTDLLVGVIIGMILELFINLFNGLSFSSIFSSGTEVREGDKEFVLVPRNSAVFSNWLALRGKIVEFGLNHKKNIVVDLSQTKLVDHTVMEKLHEMEREFRSEKLELKVVGLEKHTPFSSHPAAARKRTSV